MCVAENPMFFWKLSTRYENHELLQYLFAGFGFHTKQKNMSVASLPVLYLKQNKIDN